MDKKLSFAEFCRLLGKKESTVRLRMAKGYSIHDSCFIPKNSSDFYGKHGMYKSKTYYIWSSMNSRCKRNKTYVSRGIKVSEEWCNFETFLRDMGEKPEGMSLDRIDNDKGYSKENCRWTDNHTQNRNRSDNRWLTMNGETLIVSDWARKLGMSISTLNSRLRSGKSVIDALTNSIDKKYSSRISLKKDPP